MDKQHELLLEATSLAQAYPDAKIHVCVATDEMVEYYKWTDHHISKVKFGELATYDGMIFTDRRRYVDAVDWQEEREPTEEELDAAFEPAILIYTRA